MAFNNLGLSLGPWDKAFHGLDFELRFFRRQHMLAFEISNLRFRVRGWRKVYFSVLGAGDVTVE